MNWMKEKYFNGDWSGSAKHHYRGMSGLPFQFFFQNFEYLLAAFSFPTYHHYFTAIVIIEEQNVLCILTSIWVLCTPNTWGNIHFQHFLYKKLKKREKSNKFAGLSKKTTCLWGLKASRPKLILASSTIVNEWSLVTKIKPRNLENCPILFWPAFGVRSTQTLVKICNKNALLFTKSNTNKSVVEIVWLNKLLKGLFLVKSYLWFCKFGWSWLPWYRSSYYEVHFLLRLNLTLGL